MAGFARDFLADLDEGITLGDCVAVFDIDAHDLAVKRRASIHRLIRLDRARHAHSVRNIRAAHRNRHLPEGSTRVHAVARLLLLRGGEKRELDQGHRDDDPRECLDNIEHLRGAGLTCHVRLL